MIGNGIGNGLGNGLGLGLGNRLGNGLGNGDGLGNRLGNGLVRGGRIPADGQPSGTGGPSAGPHNSEGDTSPCGFCGSAGAQVGG